MGQILQLAATTLTLGTLMITCWYNVNVVFLTRKSLEMSAINHLNAELWRPEVQNGLDALDRLTDNNLKQYGATVARPRAEWSDETRETDSHRLALLRWVDQVYAYYRQEHISVEGVQKLGGPGFMEHILDITERAEATRQAATKENKKTAIHYLRLLLRIKLLDHDVLAARLSEL